MSATGGRGLSLEPFRALRPTADSERLGRLLCPPYDVIDPDTKSRLLAGDPENAVSIILPEPTSEGYADASRQLAERVTSGLYAVDREPALYVYEMREGDAQATRGLLGAVELRAAEDGVILPHENTMAGPVADRLEVMTATDADLEPIYLVYDGGGPASLLLATVDDREPLAQAKTPDGITHRLWAISDEGSQAVVRADLAGRHALIADGHHRYATYLERQRRRQATDGGGPWDRGLALLVDSSKYGPQVHAIHRVLPSADLDEAVGALEGWAAVMAVTGDPATALESIGAAQGFAAVLTDGQRSYVVADETGKLTEAAGRPGDVPALAALDVTVVHRGLVETVWGRRDDVDTVGYAHSVEDAVNEARAANGFAVLLRPTPVTAVADIAAAGARMPRKSTLFTPKPASGLVLRRLGDQ